jgi:hypothetical protein
MHTGGIIWFSLQLEVVQTVALFQNLLVISKLDCAACATLYLTGECKREGAKRGAGVLSNTRSQRYPWGKFFNVNEFDLDYFVGVIIPEDRIFCSLNLQY